MPVLKFDVQEVSTRTLHSIAKQCVLNMFTRLGLREVFGKNIYIKDGQTAVSNPYTDDRVTLSSDRVDVAVTYQLGTGDQLYDTSTNYNIGAYGMANNQFSYGNSNYGRTTNTDRISRNVYPMILKDPSIGTYLSEFTNICGMTFNITISTNTSDLAYKTLMILNNTYHGEGVFKVHDFKINYPLNLSLLIMLKNIYACKIGNSKFDSDDFILYVKEHVTKNFLLSRDVQKGDIENTDINKKHNSIWVVNRNIKEALELTTVESSSPEPELVNQGISGFTLNINTRLQFAIPTMMLLTVPVSINNTPLPSVFFSNIGVSQAGYFSQTRGIYQVPELDQLTRSTRDVPCYERKLIKFPTYDDWMPPQNVMKIYQRPLLSAIDIIDDTDKHEIDLINDFHGYMLSDFVIDILKQHTADDLFGDSGLFNVKIFSQLTKFSRKLLDFDNDNLIITYNTTFKNTVYRIVLSEATDMNNVDRKWYPILVKYRYYFPMTITRNLDTLLRNNIFEISAPTKLYTLLDKLDKTDKLFSVIDQMIFGGHVPTGIYRYTQTLNQFSWYLSNTRMLTNLDMLQFNPDLVENLPFDPCSKDGNLIPDTNNSIIIHPTNSDNFEADRLILLLDLFLEICKKDKLISKNTIIKPILTKNQPTPFILESVDTNVDNAPIRIKKI